MAVFVGLTEGLQVKEKRRIVSKSMKISPARAKSWHVASSFLALRICFYPQQPMDTTVCRGPANAHD